MKCLWKRGERRKKRQWKKKWRRADLRPWAEKGGRPDGAAGPPLIAGSFNQLKVKDVQDLSRMIRRSRNTSVQIQPPSEALACCVGKCWKFARGVRHSMLTRSWESTFLEIREDATCGEFHAGRREAQSLARGLQELAWATTVYNELTQPHFELKEWNVAVRKGGCTLCRTVRCVTA